MSGPDFIPDDKFVSDESKYGEGALNTIKAGAAGVARGLTFGLSDVALTKSGLVNPETLAGLEEHQPEASILGEGLAVGASMLVPGAGEANAARMATAPVRGVSRMGQAITKGVERILPEATGVIGKAGKIAASHAVGLGAEGAVYGLGRSATDYAEDKLGDPDTAAQKVLSNVGMTSMLAGTLGAGLGLSGAALRKGIGTAKGYMKTKPLPEAGQPAIIETPVGKESIVAAPEGTMERAMQENGVPAVKREEVNAASNRLHPDHQARMDAAKEIGAPILESYISGSDKVRTMDASLMTSQTFAGEKRLLLLEDGFNKARQQFSSALETGEARSAHEIGAEGKDLIKAQIDATYKPTQSLYKKLGPDAENLLAPENRLMDFMGELLDKAEKPPPGSSVGGPRKKLFEHWAERLQDQKTLGNIDGLYTDISNAERSAWSTRNYSEAHALGEIKDMFKTFQEGLIDEAHISFAKQTGMPLGEAADLAKALKDDRILASSKYKAFVDLVGDLVGAVKLGKARTYREVMQALEKIEPSKLAKNAFSGDRINSLRKLQKNFPEAFDVFANQEKKMFLESVTKEGRVDPVAAGKYLKEIPKEIQEMLFTKEQITKMNAAFKYSESQVMTPAAVSKINPSGTEKAQAARRYFSLNPADLLKSAGQDLAAKITEARLAASAEEMHALSQVESAAIKTSKKIFDGAKDIFNRISDRKGAGIGFTSKEFSVDRSNKEKLINQVRELKVNPDKFVALLEKSTEGFYNAAPKVSAGIHSSAVNAVNYLALHAPETESQYPLGSKPVPSNYEMRIFAERLHVLDNPTSILQELRDGTLVPEHIEAVATVYPKLMQEMQTAVMDSLTDAVAKKQDISYQTKNMLSLFLNQDLDESITAQAIVSNQSAIHRAHIQDKMQQAQAGGVRPTQKGLGNLDMSTEKMTAMQKSAQRINA